MKKFTGVFSAIYFLLCLIAAGAASGGYGFLEPYEEDYKAFKRLDIGEKIVFFRQRMIDGAVIEKDYDLYHFHRETGELLKRDIRHRKDLPEHFDIRVPQADAEWLAGGRTLFSILKMISPDSDVYPIDPAPKNPCWVVRCKEEGAIRIKVIDAVTGEYLGDGIAPPYEGFALTGPWYDYPCSGSWSSWSGNAQEWFNTMGYNCEEIVWPTQAQVASRIQNNTVGMFYELAHGGSAYFASGCSGGSAFEYTYSSEVESWISSYPKMPFTFIGSCEGMCSVGNGTFSYVFRKGSSQDAVTVGYCGMSEYYCDTCWDYSISWQNSLFSRMNAGWTVKDAFDQAQADYPACAGSNNCMRFAGDAGFAGPYIRGGGTATPTSTATHPTGTATYTPTITPTSTSAQPTETSTPTRTPSSTRTATRTPTITPSYTGTPTRSPTYTPTIHIPTRTPTRTPTVFIPTETPTETPSPTSFVPTEPPSPTFHTTSTPSPRPTLITEPVITGELNQQYFSFNDEFIYSVTIENPGPAISVDEYIFLDLGPQYGPFQYYFWPSWGLNIDFMTRDLHAGEALSHTPLRFQVPFVVPMGPFRLWAAVTEAGTFSIFSIDCDIFFFR